jgi:pimeloyl-ACP methyl ester carboxylesterase
MNSVTLKDTNVFYVGPEKNRKSAAPNWIFLHGAGGDHTCWINQWEYFKEKVNVYLLELPGHGNSQGSGASSISEYGDVVKDFIEALALSPATLIGHSMGGAIAQYLAIHHPDQLKSIVLAGTGAKLKVTPEILGRIQNHFQEVVATISKYGFGPETSKELVYQFQKQMEQSNPAVLYKDFVACNQFDFLGKVHDIRLPTLILCGRVDALTPPKYSQYLHEQIQGSILKYVNGAGHMLMLEKPEVFNQELELFLNR